MTQHNKQNIQIQIQYNTNTNKYTLKQICTYNSHTVDTNENTQHTLKNIQIPRKQQIRIKNIHSTVQKGANQT